MINDKRIDNGQGFDFGRTSTEYAKYRDIYPKELYDKLYALGIGRKDSDWLDLGTGTGIIPRGLAEYGANIVGTDISKEQIEQAKMLSKGFENIDYKVVPAEEIDYPENSFDAITACQCFWYFDPEVIVPKIKKILKPDGIFMKIYMTWLKEDPIASKSTKLVKKLNSNWSSGSPSVRDLTTHYFDNPQMDTFIVDIPFTRKSWHGRMKACRGTLAAMDKETFALFEDEHIKMMNKLPEEFSIKHKVFLTYYYMK